MFPANLLGSSVKQREIFLLASFIKRNVPSQIVQICPVSAAASLDPGRKSKSGNMPCLPVQPLELMLDKYVRSIKPFVDSSQFEKTKQLVKSFCENENLGKKLQKLLEEKAESTDNWLADWWLATAYLEYRNPVIVYSSPGLVWPRQEFKTINDQLLYASHVIAAALDFNIIVEQKKIPQEKLGGRHLLCMSQYDKIFGTCRIPKMPKDDLLFQDPRNPSINIVVMYNNHMFSLPVFQSKSRRPLTPGHFYGMLLEVIAQGDQGACEPIGVLTTEHRDKWAKVYEVLKRNRTNKELLEEHVEKALFVVCLDKPLTLGSGLNYHTRCGKLLLHGFGLRGNAGNRWYDKTVQFIVGAGDDGVGIAYEHSPAEGGPIGVMTDFVVEKTKTIGELQVPSNCPKPKRLDFDVNDEVKKAILEAGEAVDKISQDLDVYGWSFDHFGKEAIKKLKVSPDSFIQVGIQYAFYKIHKHPGAQYESGSLRKYIYGRTDTIRTCSEEVVRFCQTMTDVQATREEKEKALRFALKSHKMYAEEVIEGRGVDRHLLGLKILAKINNIEDTKLFSDVAFQRSTYFQLSTSNVPTKCNGFMVYGPLVEDGYACCYNPRENNINFGTSAWSYCRETRLNGFKFALEEALVEMKDCLSVDSLQSKL